MAQGVKVKVWGDFACFTRPEMKVERVSYDVMTPSAARGVLEAIYWKPQIRWVIERVHVLNPIRFANIRRNELGGKIPIGAARKAMSEGRGKLGLFIDEERQQRASLVLRDVAYVIHGRFELADSKDANTGKHKDIIMRRIRTGQCFHRPYLGCREFPAFFEPVEGEVPTSALHGERDLGWMLHDMDYANGMQPKFFRAVMVNGVIQVPLFDAGGIRS